MKAASWSLLVLLLATTAFALLGYSTCNEPTQQTAQTNQGADPPEEKCAALGQVLKLGFIKAAAFIHQFREDIVIVRIKDVVFPEPVRKPGGVITVILLVKNTGQTPAHDFQITSRTDMVKFPFPPGFDFPLSDLTDRSVGLIGAGETTESDSRSDPLQAIDWEHMSDPRSGRQLCTYGTASYRDVFGQTQQTNFCIVHAITITFDIEKGASISLASRTADQHNDAS